MEKESKLINQYWTDTYFGLHYKHEESISHQAIRILQMIEKTDLHTVGDIAKYLGISHNTASEHVKKLVMKGYLLKSRNPEDERKVMLELTEIGAEMLKKNTSLDEVKLGRILRSLTEEQRTMIVESLKLLSEAAR